MNSAPTINLENIDRLIAFRNKIYLSFPQRADSIMDLMDSLSSNLKASSPVELSLSSLFRREYASVLDAIQNLASQKKLKFYQFVWQRIIAGHIPTPVVRPFYLIGIDATGYPRPFAPKLKDRTVNYHPNPVLNNKPIAIGHAYSLMAALPEKGSACTPPWVIPLSMRRIPSERKAIHIATDQISALLNDDTLPFKVHLSAVTLDSGYSAVEFLNSTATHKNLVTIVRVRSNRIFYHKPVIAEAEAKKGHPVWYGDVFDMKKPLTFGAPQTESTLPITFKNGRKATVTIDVWTDLIMRGKRNMPMHQNPFTLLRMTVCDENGNLVFKRPLWLLVMGDRRLEIKPDQVYFAYRQRYDLEHFFRFGKQKLLLTAYQTPEVHHEENWCSLVALAYAQLYLMAPLANRLPQPWERYLPNFKDNNTSTLASPTIVQRDAKQILNKVGSPACPSKPRGIPPGRSKGAVQEKRENAPIIFKKKNPPKSLSP